MKTYKILTLGLSGSGKTVFLASLFKQLSTQGEYGFFLRLDDPLQQRQLNQFYTDMITGQDWPQTATREITQWRFTCAVKTPDLAIYPACQFVYTDYPGGLLTDIAADESPEYGIDFEKEVEQSDAVLAILDGEKVLKFLQGQHDTSLDIWLHRDLPILLHLIQRCRRIPVHFLVSKWDIIANYGSFDLGDIRYRMSKIKEFRDVVRQRNEGNCPIRLIPVSSVGLDFAILSEGVMKKIPQALPNPFLVEVPLSCVLVDGLQAQIEGIKLQQREILNRQTEVLPKFSFLEQINQQFSRKVLATLAIFIRQLLPQKYQFQQETLQKLMEFMQQNVTKMEEKVISDRQEVERIKQLAEKESKILEQQKLEALQKVNNEATALDYAIKNFIKIIENLDKNFPESNLGGSGI